MVLEQETPELYWRLGNCQHALGRFAPAARHYWSALSLRPDFPEATVNLANTLIDLGKPPAAVAELKGLLTRYPTYPAALAALGSAEFAQNNLAEAVEAFSAALKLRPDDPVTQLNLASLKIALGDAASVIDDLRGLARQWPNAPDVQNALGLGLRATGDLDEAITAFQKALRMDAGNPDYLTNLAGAWQLKGRLDRAGESYQLAIEARPGFVPAYLGLGSALILDGQAAEAEAFLTAAVDGDPGNADAWSNLGNALKAQTRYDDAITAYRQSVKLRPDDKGLWSNLLLCLRYDPSRTAAEIYDEHLAFGRTFGQGAEAVTSAPPLSEIQTLRASRPLRVGYVSADFRSHSVAFFLEPVLRAHDRNAVEVICYSDVAAPDGVTSRLRGLSDGWRDLRGRDDSVAADMIRSDAIDLLVDLSGHTAGNRLGVFAERAAPIQLTWLGYPGTTGLAEMDYRLTDEMADPDDSFHTEQMVRLPHGFHCYGPPPNAPVPSRSEGRPLTFGSFNNLAKITPDVMSCWARLTASVPDARLLLKARPLADAKVREQFIRIAEEAGLTAGRLTLVGHVKDLAEHLALYRDIDVALDPFPYAGTTTTCEAMWMGVPVVTLRGTAHAGRVGASLLTTVGLDDLIADDLDEYAGIATALIADRARLADDRQTLRARVAASPLCHAEDFTRSLEDAYHTLWLRQNAPD
tara:strand:+ start:130713 stop:132794 length:2082 start_codon:yes stop_codon:yes gene_type:complete